MDKLEFIEFYIRSCDAVINCEYVDGARELQDEIIGVFGSEIPDIKNKLKSYGPKDQIDFIGDIKLIKQKLINYEINFQNIQNKMKYDLELARLKQPQLSAHAEANPTQTATATANVTVTVEQAIKQIDKISEDSLSNIDKDKLKEYLYSLEGIKAARDRNKLWVKAKEILKFIADKGADAAIAGLPFIITAIQSIK